MAELFGTNEGERMLLEAFATSFNDPAAEVVRFLRRLKEVALPFDLLAQLRKQEYPGYPTFECGLPTSYYYFVPDSGWGSLKSFPDDPLDDSFVYCTDGFGLNLGCPLRLKRAVEILTDLPEDQRAECARNLALSAQHLATVEELLWLDIWKSSMTASRSEGRKGMTHDWKVNIDGIAIRQECKSRPFDWARQVDGAEFIPKSGCLLGKAAKQLPDPTEQGTFNVVSVTGIGVINDDLRRIVAAEIGSFPNIDALIYRNWASETAVFSKSKEVAEAIHRLIAPQPAIPFQVGYSVTHNLAEVTRRRLARAKGISKLVQRPLERVFEIPVDPLPPRKTFNIPRLPYRSEIVDRLTTGEPVYRTIVPYLVKARAST